MFIGHRTIARIIRLSVMMVVCLEAEVTGAESPQPGNDVLWEEDFTGKTKISARQLGWCDIHDKTAKSLPTQINEGRFIIHAVNKNKKICIGRKIPYKFNTNYKMGYNYFQFRIDAGSAGALSILDGHLTGVLFPKFRVKPGLYTVDYFAATRPDSSRKKMNGVTSLNLYIDNKYGPMAFSTMRVARYPSEGVFIRAKSANGDAKCLGTDLQAGDIMRIEMPVPEPLDANSLSFYIICGGKMVPVNFRNAPPFLYDDGTNGDAIAGDHLYSCEFTLQSNRDLITSRVNHFMVSVHVWGQDYHDRGDYYGFGPYVLNIRKSLPPQSAHKQRALKLFDLGPEGSEIQERAIPVNCSTRYSEKRGWGWIVAPARSVKSKVSALDPLFNDYLLLQARHKCCFQVKVPAGNYMVAVGLGALGTRTNREMNMPLGGCRIHINGKQVYESTRTLADRLHLMENDYSTDDDIYDIFVKPYIKMHSWPTRTVDNKLTIMIEAVGEKSIPITCISVCSADDVESVNLMSTIEKQRRMLFNNFWNITNPASSMINDALVVPASRLQEIFSKQKYAVFVKYNAYKYIYINSRPALDELTKDVDLYAAKGEITATSIGVYPLADLQDFKVDVTELRNAGNKQIQISADNIKIHYVVQYHYADPLGHMHWIAPNHFLPTGSRNFEKGVCRNYWLNISVPQDASPGVYTGKIIFSSKNAPQSTLRVRLRIVPFSLPALSDHLIAFINHMWFRGPEYLDNEMRFMKNLGCTTAECHFSWPTVSEFIMSADGKKITGIRKLGGLSTRQIDTWLDRYIKTGFIFKKPVMGLQTVHSRPGCWDFGPYKAFSPEYVNAVKYSFSYLVQRAANKGIAGIVAYQGGELGSATRIPLERNLQVAIKVFKIVNEVPGVQTLYDSNCGKSAEELSPLVDIAGMRTPAAWRLADKKYEFGKKKWIITYSVGGRFNNGLKSWMHGARGNLREYLTYPFTFPYNDFIGGRWLYHIHAMEGVEGPVATIRSESWRASIVDRRYIRLLENVLAKSGQSPIANNAANFLKLLKSEIAALPRLSHRGYWELGAVEPDSINSDIVRQIIAQFVLLLRYGRTGNMPHFRPTEEYVPENIHHPVLADPPEARIDYNDKGWVDIKIGRSWESQLFDYDGEAWYRVKFRVPASWKNARLCFDAVDDAAWVYVNGKYVGKHDGWNEPFMFDISNVFAPGKENSLAVKVLDRGYGGGIWKRVTISDSSVHADASPVVSQCIDLRNAHWKLVLRPARTMSVMRLKYGRLYTAGKTDRLMLYLRLVPNNDNDIGVMLGKMLDARIFDADGKVIAMKKLENIAIYRPVEKKLSISLTRPGNYSLGLFSREKRLYNYDFYVLPELDELICR